MNRLVVLAVTLVPTLAVAHPDHSHGAYNLAHYLTGSHLIMGLVAVLTLYFCYRGIRAITDRIS